MVWQIYIMKKQLMIGFFKANRPKAEKILYSDFKEGDYGYKEAIEVVYDYIMDTYKDGTFKPNKKITKGELARYLVNALNLQTDFYEKYSGDELKFVEKNKKSDVLEIDNDNNYIELCMEKGIFKDISVLDKKGDSNKEITGQEFISALINGSKLKNKSLKGEKLTFDGFNDNNTVSRAECAVSFSKFKNLVK